jgi:hypothetical protein
MRTNRTLLNVKIKIHVKNKIQTPFREQHPASRIGLSASLKEAKDFSKGIGPATSITQLQATKTHNSFTCTRISLDLKTMTLLKQEGKRGRGKTAREKRQALQAEQ